MTTRDYKAQETTENGLLSRADYDEEDLAPRMAMSF